MTSDGDGVDGPSGLKGHPRNTDGLKAHAKKKALDKRRQVHETLDRLAAAGVVVSFLSVSKEAGVAKSYLYAHEDVKERISALSALRGDSRLRLISGPVQEASRTDKSKDVLLAAKDRKIKELAEENRKLKDQVKRLNGRLYENLSAAAWKDTTKGKENVEHG